MPIPSAFLLVLREYGLDLENGPESSGMMKKAEKALLAVLRFPTLK